MDFEAQIVLTFKRSDCNLIHNYESDMKLTENDILKALKSTITLSDLTDKLPSLSEERLNEFYESISSRLLNTAEAEVFIDGASDSEDNGGIGIVLKSNGKNVKNISRSVGKKTNNEAEYLAMIAGLELALNNNFNEIIIYSDSELLVNQINGKYKVKAKNLRPLFDQVLDVLDEFAKYEVTWIPRDKNGVADDLAKQGSKQ